MTTYLQGSFRFRRPATIIFGITTAAGGGIMIWTGLYETVHGFGRFFMTTIGLLLFGGGLLLLLAYFTRKVTEFEITDKGIRTGRSTIPWDQISRIGIDSGDGPSTLYFQPRGWFRFFRYLNSDTLRSHEDCEAALKALRDQLAERCPTTRFG